MENATVSIGAFHTFYKKKYKCIGYRSTEERANALKKRLERLGTIKVHVVKHTFEVVGLPPQFSIWARPEKTLGWDRLDKALMRLM